MHETAQIITSWAAVIAAIASLVGAIAALRAAHLDKKNHLSIQDIKVQINGHLGKLLQNLISRDEARR
jgi:hypothetical protein